MYILRENSDFLTAILCCIYLYANPEEQRMQVRQKPKARDFSGQVNFHELSVLLARHCFAATTWIPLATAELTCRFTAANTFRANNYTWSNIVYIHKFNIKPTT